MNDDDRALIAEVRGTNVFPASDTNDALNVFYWRGKARALADALEAAERDKREAQAEALEAAAGDMEDADFRRDGAMLVFGNTRFVYVEDWLRARAVEIREGRQ